VAARRLANGTVAERDAAGNSTKELVVLLGVIVGAANLLGVEVMEGL